MKPLVFPTLVLSTLVCHSAHALEYNFYGSIRFAAEAVNPDRVAALDDYSGLRDAYSRIGVQASHALNEHLSTFATLELPLDIDNKAVQDPWDQNEDIRVAKLGVKGDFGNVAIGQMWMPFYNAIAYPVDMFSSYYSGFATYTTFRKGDTIAYYSPNFGPFAVSAGFSLENGAEESDGNLDDRLQLTASYTTNAITLAVGLDDLGGANNQQILGASLSYKVNDALYFGAKYETHQSDVVSGYGLDGDSAANIYAGYSTGKNTFKMMLAQVDQYGEQIIHLGIDRELNDQLKLFVEYYSEEETAAITSQRGGLSQTCWSCGGGDVITAGLRYDFSSK